MSGLAVPGRKGSLYPGERFDERMVVPVCGCARSGPGQAGHSFPRCIRLPLPVTDQVCRMGQAGAMMACHAMKQHRLQIAVRQQVGRPGHLVQGRARPAHRHNDPAHSRLGNDPRLSDILRIVAIDRRQGHDRSDLKAGDELAQSRGILPGCPNQPAGLDHVDTFAIAVLPAFGDPGRDAHDDRKHDKGTQTDPKSFRPSHSPPASEWTFVSPQKTHPTGDSSLRRGCGNPKMVGR